MQTDNPAVAVPVERPVRPAVAVAHRSDEHLTLLGAPWHLNLLTGQDRADMLAFGRACIDAEGKRIADVCNERAGQLKHHERIMPAHQSAQAKAAMNAYRMMAAEILWPTPAQDGGPDDDLWAGDDMMGASG